MEPFLSDRISLFENPRISVWYRPTLKAIHHQVHSPAFGDVFRAALTAGVEAMKANHSTRWLSDDRLNSALLPEDLTWVDQVWSPQTLEAGWKSWALLPPTSVVGQLNIRKHVELWKSRGIMVDVFTDLANAEKWLGDQ